MLWGGKQRPGGALETGQRGMNPAPACARGLYDSACSFWRLENGATDSECRRR